MEFHYPNFQNDMWRVYGLVFFDDKEYFRKGEEKAFDADKIKAFLSEKGIASCPTVLQMCWSKFHNVNILVQQVVRRQKFC